MRAPTPGRALPPYVVSHVSGGRDVWSDPLPSRPADPVAAAWTCLNEVLDPELPVGLVDLGLICDVRVQGEVAEVVLTFTATACPCMDFIREDICDRLLQESWVSRVDIEEVWDPPWSSERITPAGREHLRRIGVGV